MKSKFFIKINLKYFSDKLTIFSLDCPEYFFNILLFILVINFANKQQNPIMLQQRSPQIKPIEPLNLKNQKCSQDKQNIYSYTRSQHNLCTSTRIKQKYHLNNNKENNKDEGYEDYHQNQKTVLNCRENQVSKRFKTSQNGCDVKMETQFLNTFYNTSQEFIKTHKPFLENKRIVFNVKNRNRSNFVTKTTQNQNSTTLKQSNIEKLKKQILQLDKEDFVSYRSKICSTDDEIKVIQNQKINKYNYQNSMIVQWKGKIHHKPFIARPSSTIGISVACGTPPPRSFIGLTSHTSVAKKYFSKPKAKKAFVSCNTTQILGQTLQSSGNSFQKSKIKFKPQEIAIGLNMFRGKMHRKKINSSFQINY